MLLRPLPSYRASTLARALCTSARLCAPLQGVAASKAAFLAERFPSVAFAGGPLPNLISGGAVPSAATSHIDVHDPATQTLLTKVPESTPAEFQRAVQAAERAFPAWKATSLLGRQQVMFRLQHLLRKHMDDLAACIVLEQGKTFGDARGDVLRGLQVVEVACGITSTALEERLEVATDMDTYVRKEPLGVTAAIAPFNFPAMIPLCVRSSVSVPG